MNPRALPEIKTVGRAICRKNQELTDGLFIFRSLIDFSSAARRLILDLPGPPILRGLSHHPFRSSHRHPSSSVISVHWGMWGRENLLAYFFHRVCLSSQSYLPTYLPTNHARSPKSLSLWGKRNPERLLGTLASTLPFTSLEEMRYITQNILQTH